MAMPDAATVAALIAADIGTADALTISALTKIVDHILSAVKAGTVAVPGLGLLAPPGTGGGPVTGSATGTIS